MTYREKFKDPRWQKKRLEIMERDGFKCRCCGSEKSTLNVHHSYYVKGRDPWHYPQFSLRTLCEECHENLHGPLAEDEEAGFMEWEDALDFFIGNDPSGVCEADLWSLGCDFGLAEELPVGRKFQMMRRAFQKTEGAAP